MIIWSRVGFARSNVWLTGHQTYIVDWHILWSLSVAISKSSTPVFISIHACLLPSFVPPPVFVISVILVSSPPFISLRTVEMARKSHKMLMKMKTLKMIFKKGQILCEQMIVGKWVEMLMKNKKQFEEEGPILTNPDFFLKLAIFQLGIGPPPLSPPHRKMNGKKSINRVSS